MEPIVRRLSEGEWAGWPEEQVAARGKVSWKALQGVNDDDDMSGVSSDMKGVNDGDVSGISSDMKSVNDGDMSGISVWHARCQ